MDIDAFIRIFRLIFFTLTYKYATLQHKLLIIKVLCSFYVM